jgi:hypothetical protein
MGYAMNLGEINGTRSLQSIQLDYNSQPMAGNCMDICSLAESLKCPCYSYAATVEKFIRNKTIARNYAAP